MKSILSMMVVGAASLAWGGAGVWANLTTGEWNDPNNWVNGAVGGGAGSIIQIQPGFAEGTRMDDRWMQVPDEGVMASTIQLQSDTVNSGAIRIWGGPINLVANGNGVAELTGPWEDGRLIFLAPPTGDVDVKVNNAVFATKAAYTGRTIVENSLAVYDHCYAAEPGETGTNYLPATELELRGANVYNYARGGWGAKSADFALVEGSRRVICTEALDLGLGAYVTGEGVPEGTFLKASITEFEKELSQPATATGTFTLNIAGVAGGQLSVQSFQKIKTVGGGTVNIINHNGGLLRWDVDELEGTGVFTKKGYGLLSVGMGENFTGELCVGQGTVEIHAASGAQPTFDTLSTVWGEVCVPDAETMVQVRTLVSTGLVLKTGAGTVAAKRLGAGMGKAQLRVENGAVEIGDGRSAAGCPVGGAWFHVDASALDTLEVTEENGTNFVTRWSDCEGGPVYAGVSTGAFSEARPWISTNYFGGKPVVDFGTLLYQENNVVQKPGYGASLAWSVENGNVCEVFMVYADTEEELDASNRTRNFLLGHPGGDYSFHRGFGSQLFIDPYASDRLRGGLIEVDGVVQPINYELPTGFHLIHLRPTGNVRAGAFARNRDYGFGGQRLAEVIIFNRALTDDEAASVADYLNAKWFEGVPAPSLAQLEVAGDAEIVVDAADTLAVGTLAINGDVVKRGKGVLSADRINVTGEGRLIVEEGSFRGGTNTMSLGVVDISDGAAVGAAAGGRLRVNNVKGSGTLAKDGAGTVEAGAISPDVQTIEVRAGTLEMRVGELPGGAWFHVDASAAHSLTTVTEGDTTYVTQWRDCDGGGIVADNGGTSPFINTNYFGGRPVIDFGSYHYPVNDGGVTVQGYGASMVWNVADTSIREVFMVYADTDDIDDLQYDKLTPNFLLGDTGGFDFHRGLNREMFISPYAAAAVREGLIEVDGVPCGSNNVLGPGFHLIHLRTTGNVRANAFANNRWMGLGGQRLAEVVIYNTPLSDEAATAATAYLLGKWWGGGEGTTRVFDGVDVAAGATFDLTGADVAVQNLACAGTIRATTLAPCTLTLASDGEGVPSFTLDGQFDARTPGVVMLTGEMLPKRANAVYPVAAVNGVVDAPTLLRWQVRGEALPSGWVGHLALRDGQLVLTLNPGGVTLFIR